jgi:excisionase family DNA binding protein
MSTVDSKWQPEAVSIPRAAHLLSVSQSTVRRLLHRGDLRSIQIGRSVRVLRISIEALIARTGGSHVA